MGSDTFTRLLLVLLLVLLVLLLLLVLQFFSPNPWNLLCITPAAAAVAATPAAAPRITPLAIATATAAATVAYTDNPITCTTAYTTTAAAAAAAARTSVITAAAVPVKTDTTHPFQPMLPLLLMTTLLLINYKPPMSHLPKPLPPGFLRV
jgi:hypothetical protein